jgi:hypothetical protein
MEATDIVPYGTTGWLCHSAHRARSHEIVRRHQKGGLPPCVDQGSGGRLSPSAFRSNVAAGFEAHSAATRPDVTSPGTAGILPDFLLKSVSTDDHWLVQFDFGWEVGL